MLRRPASIQAGTVRAVLRALLVAALVLTRAAGWSHLSLKSKDDDPECSRDAGPAPSRLSPNDPGTRPTANNEGGTSEGQAVATLLQAYAALAGTVVGSFALRQPNVPVWAVVAAFVLVVILLGAPGLWLVLVRATSKRMALGRAAPAWGPAATSWRLLAFVVPAALTFLAGLVLVQGLKPIPNYTSVYDGNASEVSACARTAERAEGQGFPTVRDHMGKAVGTVRLISSYNCSTVWAELVYARDPHPDVKLAQITMTRPADGATAPFRSRPDPYQAFSRGNMLFNGKSCVRAEVFVVDRVTGRPGPTASSPCV